MNDERATARLDFDTAVPDVMPAEGGFIKAARVQGFLIPIDPDKVYASRDAAFAAFDVGFASRDKSRTRAVERAFGPAIVAVMAGLMSFVFGIGNWNSWFVGIGINIATLGAVWPIVVYVMAKDSA